jgi:hypothetical protein
MQPGGPFTLIAELGSSQLGSVWSAIGPDGNPATVAVLNVSMANDKKWRDAFAAAATALANPQADGPRFLSANFSASAPWAAFAGGDGPGAEVIFTSLGVEYRPAPPSLAAPSTSPAVIATGQRTMAPPTISAPAPPPAQFGTPVLPTGGEGPSGSRRRAGTWVAVAVVAVLVAATMVVAWRAVSGIAEPTAASTTTPPAPAASTATAPQPGLEPPLPGTWPTSWPKFRPPPAVRPLTLDGFGFTFIVPVTWSCVAGGSGAGEARYACRAPIGDDQDIGGEVIVRDCASPCDDERRALMRSTEHAWGQRWRFVGQNVTIAETHTLDGRPEHYGLALIAYWSSTPNGAVDRQLVLRMDSPEVWLNDLRKFANTLRDAVKS